MNGTVLLKRALPLLGAALTMVAIAAGVSSAQNSCCQTSSTSGPSCRDFMSSDAGIFGDAECAGNGGQGTTGSCDAASGLCGGTTVCCDTTCDGPPECENTTAAQCPTGDMSKPVLGSTCDAASGECRGSCPAPPGGGNGGGNGAACTENSDCESGHCSGLLGEGLCNLGVLSLCTCTPPPDGGGAGGDSCTAASQCTSGRCQTNPFGLDCPGIPGIECVCGAVPPPPGEGQSGEPCSTGSECASGACQDCSLLGCTTIPVGECIERPGLSHCQCQ